MCLLPVRFGEMVSPRYVLALVTPRCTLWRLCSELIVLRLFVMWRTLHFDWLKSICHFFIHSSEDRATCSVMASSGDETGRLCRV